MEKMLIADDNRQITAVLTAYARKEGFEPVVAYDGEEALAAYRREAPADNYARNQPFRSS